MSHVDFKKKTCRSVEFKGQGPQENISETAMIVDGCGNKPRVNIGVVGTGVVGLGSGVGSIRRNLFVLLI